MGNKEINTTKRWTNFCRAKAKDGRVCKLYSPHPDGHMAKNDLEKDRWQDGE